MGYIYEGLVIRKVLDFYSSIESYVFVFKGNYFKFRVYV